MSLLKKNSDKQKWSFLFCLWIIHGLVALWLFFDLPSDPGEFLFGVSFQRALMIGVLFGWILFNLVLLALVIRSLAWFGRLLGFLKQPTVKDIFFIVALLIIVGRILLVLVFGLLEGSGNFDYSSYAERLAPLLDLATYVSLEIIAIIQIFRSKVTGIIVKPHPLFLRNLMIVLSVLASVACFIFFTDMGIATVYKGDWARGLPAVPLLEWQILFAALLCVLVLLFEHHATDWNIRRPDLWVALGIWLCTILFWQSQPIISNASALDPIGPNYEIYPFNDAQMYDGYAQSLLVGSGLGGDQIPQRPIYIVFLSILHLLVGQAYDRVVFAQYFFLALFPVLLYLFGTEFFGRPVGISVAVLAVLRDFTSNLVSPFTGNLSYSKLYLSELPTAIFLVLFLWVGLRWIRSSLPAFTGFVLGGILGIAMLIRTQVVAALPVIFIFALITHPKRIGLLVKSALLALIGIMLVISPWLWRNWQLTGSLIFDNPATQTINLALRYSRLTEGNTDVDVLQHPGESNVEYNDRLIAIARRAVSANPYGAAKAVVSSFLNHGVNNILLFPLRNDLADLGDLWIPKYAFWELWEGRPNVSQGFLLGFYIFLFGLGVTAAWQRNGWLGFLPLGLNLIYNLWTSIALLSGQRFMLAMDWSVILYDVIGLFVLLSAILSLLENGRPVVFKWYERNVAHLPSLVETPNVRWHFLAGAFFLMMGLSLPLSEVVFLEKYPPMSQVSILNKIVLSPAVASAGIEPACLQKIATENHLEFVEGRALYPRYYGSGEGEIFTDAFGYKIADEGRIVFEMVGQRFSRIVFPLAEMPGFFPNASDVILGFDQNDGMWLVLVSQGGERKIYFSSLFSSSVCE